PTGERESDPLPPRGGGRGRGTAPLTNDSPSDAPILPDADPLSLEGEGGGEGDLTRGHGEVSVTYLATIFKKIKLHTHENIGWGKIHIPQDDLHTGAFWIALPDDIVASVAKSTVEAAIEGVGQLLVNVAPLLLMCDPGDLHLSTQTKSPHTGCPTIFLWESVPGGVGFGEHLYRETSTLLDLALGLVEGCACAGGCPGCVGPGIAGAKSAAIDVLQAMRRGVDAASAGRAGAASVEAAG
ncbi:MAG: DUF1998 domain-containing protein, partial [Chloroflexi bacterium]|nr:DUF1998 domain-containing protein [Chloroflexota bacterium]